jgi:methanethiol S-methyltransferase
MEDLPMLKRILVFAYGVISYVVFFATFLYAIGFIGDIVVPRTIDGTPTVGLWQALAVNLGLLGLFAVQHSVMARPAFKRWFTRYIPKAAERSTYVLLSSLALILLFSLWEPMGGTIWRVEDPVGQALLYGAYAFGWGLVLVATFLINHFDLFGLRQVWLHLTGRPYTPLRFTTPGPYRMVRHPLYVGWLFAFWATPVMTVAHLVFAVMTTAYILIAIQLEERDLVKAHPEYTGYRRRVPMLIPRLAARRTPQDPAADSVSG